MKRQINYILMQTVLWGGWICEYIWFLKHQFQMRFDLWVFVAYLFLLYLCVVRKLGNNNNRRYEIYMELWGRLTAVNVVWYLFVGAKTVHFAGILLVLWKLILLSTIQCITFAGIFQIYKKIMEHFQITTACVITRADTLEAAKEKIRVHDSVFLEDLPSDERNELLKFCYYMDRQVYCNTKLSDIMIRGSGLTQYHDSPVFFCNHFEMEISKRAVKRCFDLVFSVLFLVILSPLFLIIAICIKCEDGGSVIYRQVRCTRDMKKFEIYKFRSMITDAEKNRGPQLATKHDKRLTRVGRFLRNTKLDELPQLVNILKGDMSFVGPRPERPEFIVKAVEDIPEFVLRTKVKAGLTGYAQVMGNYSTSFLDKLKWDLMYIENYSLFLDFKILLMTAIAIFAKDNHEDFSKWDML